MDRSELSRVPPRAGAALVLAGIVMLGLPMAGMSQDAEPDSLATPRERARQAQVELERFRENRIPPETRGYAPCDERVGRFCFRYDDDEDLIRAEPPELTMARRDLLRSLSRAHRDAPEDDWIIGQLVFYLVEDKSFSAAEQVALECEVPAGWWCDALRGFVYHSAGHTDRASEAFADAMAGMPEDEWRFWRSTEFLFDRGGQERYAEQAEESGLDADRIVDRLWLLSDPLYLVPGNDRLTEHYARKVSTRIREDAANPYGIGWERDNEQLVIRYGNEVGWERGQAELGAGGLATDTRKIIGRQHPKSRQYVPPPEFVADPASIPADAWTIEARRPRTGYAPPYAPEITDLSYQVGRFRRGDELLLVGAYRPASPEPTLASNWIQRERPGWRRTLPPPPGDESGRLRARSPFDPPPEPPPSAEAAAAEEDPDVETGVFVLTPDGQVLVDDRTAFREGSWKTQVPNGAYIVGMEVYDTRLKEAWRARQGVRQSDIPLDLAAASDLLVLDGEGAPPETLDEAVDRLLPGVQVRSGDAIALAWEVYGLDVGDRAQVTIGFTQGRPSLLRRAGEFLRIVEPEIPVVLSWEDAGADGRTVFRSVGMALPELEPGEYTIHVEIDLPGRAPMVISRRVAVIP